MKKYLIQGVLSLVASAVLVSCHSDEDLSDSVVSQKFQAYQQVFEQEFGKINPDQDWGFGEASAATRARAAQMYNYRTRAAMPETPDFRDTNPITKPTAPTFLQTLAAVEAAGIPYAGTIDYNNGWDNVSAAYIDAASNRIRADRTNGKTFYVSGEVTYYGGVGNGSNTDVTQCVTFVLLENSTLHLGCVGHNMRIFLAPNAKLDVTKTWESSWVNNTQVVTEKDYETFTLEKSNAYLYLSAGSEVEGNNIKFFDGCNILNNGGTIKADNIDIDKNTTLWNEGTVTVKYNLQGVNENAYIYNATGKTITAQTINLINNSDLLYNNGTVKATGAITTHNSEAEIVNNGTITGASYSQAAGGKMHNVGTATFTGKTDLTNSNSEWQNDGQWTCGSFDVDNYSAKNFNNCKLTVNGKFYLNRGTFVLNGGASVVCQSFTWEDTSDFYFGSKALLSVSGTLTTNNYNSGYGFRGVGDDYAVIKAGSIVKGIGDVQYSMSYFGKLFIDTQNHFAQGAITPQNSVEPQPYYYYDSTVKFSFKNEELSGFSIPSGKCSPGYNYTAPESITIPVINGSSYTRRTYKQYRYKITQSECGRIMCEDLGKVSASDIDFNDVVFDAYIYNMVPVYRTRVTKIENGVETDEEGWGSWKEDTEHASLAYKTTDIYLLAGGGTIPVTVAGVDVKNSYLTGHTTLINTVDDSDNSEIKSYGNVYDNTQSFKQPAGLKDLRDINTLKDIKIVVKYGTQVYELEAYKGSAPHKICVPIGTRWPYERVEINQAYNFNDYVKTYTPTDTTVTYTGGESKVVKEIIDKDNNIVGYYIDESNNKVWTDQPTTEQNNNRYQGSVAGLPVPYTARAIDTLLDRTSGDGLPEDNSYTDETVTVNSGYNQGDPVLVRRRN